MSFGKWLVLVILSWEQWRHFYYRIRNIISLIKKNEKENISKEDKKIITKLIVEIERNLKSKTFGVNSHEKIKGKK